MSMYYNSISSIFIVFTSICLGYLIYKYFIYEKVLYPTCLVDTKTCVKVLYYSHGNSVLFHQEPNGYWGWFDGEDLYVFDASLTSSKCPTGISQDKDGNDVEYTSAYKITPVPTIYNTSSSNQVVCVETVSSLIKYYENLNVKKRYLYDRVDKRFVTSSDQLSSKEVTVKLDIYDTINLLEENKIIKINK